MKTYTARMAVLAVLAVFTMFGSAFAGQTQAERDLQQSADPERALGWQIAPAKEAGSLPAGGANQLKSEGAAKTKVPTVEIGGRVYRIGIDTP